MKKRIFELLLSVGLFSAGVVIQLVYGKGTFNGATMLAILFAVISMLIFYFGGERIIAFFKKEINTLIKDPKEDPLIDIRKKTISVVEQPIIEFTKKNR